MKTEPNIAKTNINDLQITQRRNLKLPMHFT
jgi:hypothetical protein